jgi:uncharacterized protein
VPSQTSLDQTNDWRQEATDYIRAQAQPIDKFGHQPRLYALASQLGQGTEYDDDIVFAAAWMHDLGVFLGHRPADPVQLARWNHVPYTIGRTRELLAEWAFPAHKIDAVAEVIGTHQPQDEPITIEAVLLRDADILEQLGAIGAFRAISKIGRDTRYATFSSVVVVLRRAREELPTRLRTPAARQLALPRVELLDHLLAALQLEAGTAP